MDPPQLPSHQQQLADAFDAERFRELGHRVVDLLADALVEAREGRTPVRLNDSPEAAAKLWAARLQPGDACDCPEALARETIAHAFRCHHPGNLGHQVGPVLPAVAALDLVGSFLDTGNGVFEVGDPATPMEHAVLQDLARRLGFPAEADGILTSGGSLGNLTALLAMRQCQTGSWEAGSGDARFAVLVSAEAHYCVTRAAKIMGWGEAGVVAVPADASYRLDPEALGRALEGARSRGLHVLGVVGSAGSTATGRIDPLGAIADFCQRHHLWFHVDAAHGGAFIFSAKARGLLRGIERADSVVIDFHKMLLSPSLLTAVLFRDGGDSFQTFAQKADYLWQQEGSREWWNGAKRTVECTRPMLGLRAFAVMKAGCDGLFEAYLDHALEVSHGFARLIDDAADFELLAEPESNIVCYRFTPEGVGGRELDTLNRRIREAIASCGDFYIVQVKLHGQLYLRSAVMNPFVEISTCESLLARIRSEGARLLDSH